MQLQVRGLLLSAAIRVRVIDRALPCDFDSPVAPGVVIASGDSLADAAPDVLAPDGSSATWSGVVISSRGEYRLCVALAGLGDPRIPLLPAQKITALAPDAGERCELGATVLVRPARLAMWEGEQRWHAAEVVAEHTTGSWAVRFLRPLPLRPSQLAPGQRLEDAPAALLQTDVAPSDVIGCAAGSAPWVVAAVGDGAGLSVGVASTAFTAQCGLERLCIEELAPCAMAVCSDSCISANDGECQDAAGAEGTRDASASSCASGTDCTDCGAYTAALEPCTDDCIAAGDGVCNDDGVGGDAACRLGSDCTDCGSRQQVCGSTRVPCSSHRNCDLTGVDYCGTEFACLPRACRVWRRPVSLDWRPRVPAPPRCPRRGGTAR